MRFIWQIMLILIAFQIASCTDVDLPAIQDVPILVEESASATVFVARRSMWSSAGYSVIVGIDGAPVARLRSGQHTIIKIETGTHNLNLYTVYLPRFDGTYRDRKCSNLFYTCWVPSNKLLLDAQQGEEIYIVVEPSLIGYLQTGWKMSDYKAWPDYIEIDLDNFVAAGKK